MILPNIETPEAANLLSDARCSVIRHHASFCTFTGRQSNVLNKAPGDITFRIMMQSLDASGMVDWLFLSLCTTIDIASMVRAKWLQNNMVQDRSIVDDNIALLY